MDDRIKESISALMDDEANELECQRVLSHVDREELNHKWQRYHLARSVMQGDEMLSQIDISEAVSKAISEENDEELKPEVAMSSPAVAPRNRTGGLLAVAASMLFAVGFVLNNGSLSDDHDGYGANDVVLNEKNPQENALTVEKQPQYVSNYSEEQSRRLNQYLLRHAEHSILGARQGAMPLVRVASYNSVGI